MTFNLNQLYHSADVQADQEIELCYSHDSVFVKPLKVKDRTELMKAIEGKDEILINRCIDNIIEKYVEMPSGRLEVKKLTSQERHQILAYIRVAYSEGDATTVMHQCPKCEHLEKKVPFKFDSLELKQFEGDALKTVKIAKDNFELDVGVVFRSDELAAESFNKKRKLKTVSEAQITLIALAIKNIRYIGTPVEEKTTDEINTEFESMTLDAKVEFVENLKQSDLVKITDTLSLFDFGIKAPLSFVCSECGYKGQEEANALLFFIS